MQVARNGRSRVKTHSSASSRLFLLLISFLGCAIIFWGAHDKVSLYSSVVAGHPVAKAKLLSGRELASDSANTATAETPAAPGPVIAFYFAAILALLFGTGLRAAPIRLTPCRSSGQPGFAIALHRRPPPSSSLSRA